jgi:hypothetical protein
MEIDMTDDVMRADGVASAHDIARNSSRRRKRTSTGRDLLHREEPVEYIDNKHGQPCEETAKPLVTRRGGVELSRSAEGIPLTKSRVDKDCMRGVGPKPAARFGRTELYTQEEFLRYARTLIRPIDKPEAA